MTSTNRSSYTQEKFAKLVKALCQERFIPQKGNSKRDEIPWRFRELPTKPWTQEYLAEVSKIKIRTIRRIVKGEKVKLGPYLERLAQAFDLTESQKIEFYATAGYFYEPAPPSDETFDTLYRKIEVKAYPATVRNALWDFLFINPLHATVRGMTSDVIQILKDNPIGPNLLLILFDPQFQGTNTSHRLPGWDVLAIRSFRRSSFRYKNTDRYQLIVEHLQQFSSFRTAWGKSFEDEIVMSLRETVMWNFSMSHPEFGLIRFASYREPLDDFIHTLSVYVPIADSEINYLEFSATVPTRKPIIFQPPPLYSNPS